MKISGKEWPITTMIFFISLCTLMLFLTWGTFFGVFEPEMPQSERIKTSLIFLVLTAILLFPIYEIVRKNIFGKKTLQESAMGYYAKALAGLPTDPVERRRKRITSTVYILIFVAFLLLPIFLQLRPTYEYSKNTLVLMWVILFPLISIRWKLLINRKFRDALNFRRVFVSSLFVGYLFFYINVIQNILDTETQEIQVYIVNVSQNTGGSDSSCYERVSIKTEGNMSNNFCIDNLIEHNLIDGDVIYIDDGYASMVIKSSWFGSIVESILWKPGFTDQTWKRPIEQ